ncbi:MAG: hypothetical protein IJ261_00385 [Clostridia bacterium]|nr:hypothetical protein [Clostridia bacterium]
MPTQLCELNNKTKPFSDSETDFSDYGKISFYAKNNGKCDVAFDKMKIYINAVTWFSPAVENTSDSSCVIPADGQWHKITLDLDSLYLHGNECFFTFANEKLDYTFKYTFEFSGTDGETDISVDHFRFTPSDAESGTRFEAKISNADNPLEFISAVFTTIIGFFFNALT